MNFVKKAVNDGVRIVSMLTFTASFKMSLEIHKSSQKIY